MSKIENVIFRVFGGIGKNVMATAVCSAIKSHYPDSKLIVLASFPDVFLNHPSVDRVYQDGATPYFFEDHVKDKEVKIFAIEPYSHEGHILEKEHLIESWCKVCGVPYNGEQPFIDISSREEEYFQNQFSNLLRADKPSILIQPFGGPINQQFKYNWNRDIPFEQISKVVAILKERFNVVQVAHDQQIAVPNTLSFKSNLRGLINFVNLVDSRLLIDSSCQHIAAALNKPSTVCWITNKPWVFGYPIHSNILANEGDKVVHKPTALFRDESWSGENLTAFPYKTTPVFNIDEIIDSVVGSFV